MLPALVSFLLPGFDQWVEGQYGPAAFYTGTATAGMFIAANALDENGEIIGSGISERNNNFRQYQLGSQLYMAAGSFSAYASFRSAVRSRQAYGQFSFLNKEETTDELLASPFYFSNMIKPTTFLPLLLLTGLVAVELGQGSDSTFQTNGYNGSDFAYGAGFSYLAGTNEEALFRGWLMPVTMQWFKSPFWSNMSTSLLFAAAHISPQNRVPWPQFVLGAYLGWVTQRNKWTLQESIFIHTWWDVIAFAAVYMDESRRDQAQIQVPLINASF